MIALFIFQRQESKNNTTNEQLPSISDSTQINNVEKVTVSSNNLNSISSNTTMFTEEDAHNILQAAMDTEYEKYTDEIKLLDENTNIDAEGNVHYFENYMESDINIDYYNMCYYLSVTGSMFEDSIYNNSNNSETLTLMLDFACTHYCIENALSDTFSSYNITENLCNMIYTCNVHGEQMDIIVTVDIINCKTRVDNVSLKQ